MTVEKNKMLSADGCFKSVVLLNPFDSEITYLIKGDTYKVNSVEMYVDDDIGKKFLHFTLKEFKIKQ